MADLAGKRVAILVDNYFEQAEFDEPLSALKAAGAEVVVVGARTKKLQGLNHVDKGDVFQADLLLDDANSEDYDALILPGGAINADHLRMNEAAQGWVRSFLEEDKPLAVICHAPWVLVSAEVVDGKRLTSYYTIQDDIQNAGGEWVDEAVVIDDTLITSRNPDDLPQFNDAIIEMLSRGPAESEEEEDETPEGSDEPTQEISDEVKREDDFRLKSLGYDKKRDELTREDARDILSDEDADDTDPDAFRSSRAVPGDERDGSD